MDNQILTTLRKRGISWIDIARHSQVNVLSRNFTFVEDRHKRCGTKN